MSDTPETPGDPSKFDFSAFSSDTLFYDRRTGLERRDARPPAPAPEPAAPAERREKKERRKRIDPTTFEKQYTPDEIEFMTAMQQFKVRTGKAFPTHAEVLAVARSIGYQRVSRAEIVEPPIADPEMFNDGAALPVTVSFSTTTMGEQPS